MTDKLRNYLKSQVDFIKQEGQSLEDISWGYQEGVLISGEEALSIIELYDTLQRVKEKLTKLEGYIELLKK
jgi:hypothetical protein